MAASSSQLHLAGAGSLPLLPPAPPASLYPRSAAGFKKRSAVVEDDSDSEQAPDYVNADGTLDYISKHALEGLWRHSLVTMGIVRVDKTHATMGDVSRGKAPFRYGSFSRRTRSVEVEEASFRYGRGGPDQYGRGGPDQ